VQVESHPPPLYFAWALNLLTLHSTSLGNPQHLDCMVKKLRDKIYIIQSNLTDIKIFENMLDTLNLLLTKMQA
jgi:hypothetical protein